MSAGMETPGARTTFGQPAHADTLADREAFLTSGLVPVSCDTCDTKVLVAKNSEKHTSIQWTSDPARTCPVYAERAAAGKNTALMDTCERLSASIATAVAEGRIEIGGACRPSPVPQAPEDEA